MTNNQQAHKKTIRYLSNRFLNTDNPSENQKNLPIWHCFGKTIPISHKISTFSDHFRIVLPKEFEFRIAPHTQPCHLITYPMTRHVFYDIIML